MNTVRFNVLHNRSRRLQSEIVGRHINRIATTLNQHMQLYGYNWIGLPTIDSADLFLVKAGDQIISSLFTFERQGKQYALRPEFTASAANYFANTDGNTVVRWQFAGSVFEDNFGDPSTNYEHFGIGAELIGLGGNLADTEIIAMAARGLEKLGLSDYHITVGHIGLIRELLRQFSLDNRTERFLLHQIPALNDPEKGKQWVFEQFVFQLASSKGQSVPITENDMFSPSNSSMTMGGRTRDDIVQRLRLKHQRLADKDNVNAAIDYLHNWCQINDSPKETFAQLRAFISGNSSADLQLQEWHKTLSLLEAHDIPLSRIIIKPSLARSWEYYTGIVFELHNNNVHVGGGGRYDELARLIGSKVDTPSVGFAYYGDRLVDLLPDHVTDREQLITIISNNDDMTNASKWANQIRNKGLSVQILPYALRNEATQEVLTVEDMTVHYKTSQYNFQQVDLLINRLKQF